MEKVATGRVGHLLAADANVTVLCPTDGLSAELSYRIAQNQISHIPRNYDRTRDLLEPSSLRSVESHALVMPDMVMTAIDSPPESTHIWKACKARKIPVNVADVPSECDFYFGSMYRDGPVQIMVSTNGNGPKMASIVRHKIEDALVDLPLGKATENLGKLRRKVREAVPGSNQASVRKRMKWYEQY